MIEWDKYNITSFTTKLYDSIIYKNLTQLQIYEKHEAPLSLLFVI